jgi:DegV family protein with EDD domain
VRPPTPTTVVTDSSCYLDPGLAASLGVRMASLHVCLGDWHFRELDVVPAEFYRRLREGDVRPTTSQPAPGELLAQFEAAAAQGAERILCITCGTNLSGTHGSATIAAGLCTVPVDLVDSRTISGGLGLIVLATARARAAGAGHDEALALARSLSGRTWSTWCSDTARLMHAGGRLAGSVPDGDGVPVLALEDEVRVLGHAHTAPEAIELQARVVLAATAITPCHVSVGHGDVPDLADALEQALTGGPGVLGVDRYVVGPAVGAHAGPGNVGVSYLAPAPA